MEYIDLIISYIGASIAYLRFIINDPWDPKFLLFTSVLGILLLMISSCLWTPFKKWGRWLGIIFTTFGLGSFMIAIFLGMDVQFASSGESSIPLSKITTKMYLKKSPREAYKTMVARSEPLTGGDQQKPVRDTLPPKGSSTSKWYEIRKWRGLGPKETETFHISSSLWKIDWNTHPTEKRSPAFFSIKVYSAEGKFIGSPARTKGEDLDSALMNRSGDYYLVIETSQKYTVSVKVQRQ